MELYIVFFTIIAVALIILAIYITKVEHLAVTNRTRIARLESQFSRLDEYNMSNRATRKISELPSTEYSVENGKIIPVNWEIAYRNDTGALKEENKSLSFQLAEVSKALQEKKLLIYEMDEKLSKLDAKVLKRETALNTCRSTIKILRDKVERLNDTCNNQAAKHFGIDLAKGDSEAVLTSWHLADGKMTPFIPEGEELKGFSTPIFSRQEMRQAYGGKPLIDVEFAMQDYVASELVEAPQAEELHDLSGSDPIFEADAAEADTAAKLNFEPLNLAGHWIDEVNEVDPKSYRGAMPIGRYSSKGVSFQNLPKPDYLIWWESLSFSKKLKLSKDIKTKITFEQVKQIWYDETGGDLE